MEDVGEVSEDEEHYGTYQKERLDDAHDLNDIWTMDDDMNLALDGEGHLSDDQLDPDNIAQGESEKDEGGNEIAWEYEIGPQERTKFDEFYDARKAKNKKQKVSPERNDRL